MHLTNPILGYEITLLYIVSMVISGFCFGLIYLNFGIVAVIATHLFTNLIVTIFIQPTRYGFYYALGINIILCIWLFVRDRRKQITIDVKVLNPILCKNNCLVSVQRKVL
jgi:hypothetical protein